MMKLFSSSQVKFLDAYTILHEPVSSIDLMERASNAFVSSFKKKISTEKKIIVLAGHGNNGGDAMAIARLLFADAYQVSVFLYNPKDNLSPDCEINKQRLLEMPLIPFFEDKTFTTFPDLDSKTVVIDGLFGSGLNKPLSGGYACLIKYVNDSPASVVAIDIPSGLFGEDNSVNNFDAIIQADLTLTFQFPSISFLMPENENYVGKWEVLDIQLLPEDLDCISTPFYLIEQTDIKALLKTRSKFAHKGNFGHALLVAGGQGKMGAAVLAAKACLRTGAGLLTVCVPACGVDILQITVPEAMVTLTIDKVYTAIGIGPGIGTDPEAVEKLSAILRHNNQPIVLDADALNILSTHPDYLELIPPGSILTPHPGELDRLLGFSSFFYDRLNKTMNLAVSLRSYVVLKGAYTAICTPEGTCYFNTTGNPGMATAGSGDVLTGIILSFLTQGYTPIDAAKIGVYLHGMAGDYVVNSGKQSEESLMSGDLAEVIGTCFLELKNKKKNETKL